MASLCESCRRQGRVFCPHNAALEIRRQLNGKLMQEMFGPTPPNVFVGHAFYPDVFWGPLVSAEPVEDDPRRMYGMGLEEIIRQRSGLVRGKRKDNVRVQSRLLSEAQDAVMSIKPVDVEAGFSKPPRFSFEFDGVVHPVGASAPIVRFELAENPSVPRKVDAVCEEGLKAAEALGELAEAGFDVHYLSKLLACGILGEKKSRKMVPTKWAITAADDVVAKRHLETVRLQRQIEKVLVYSNTYLDNRFEILLLPGNFEYEQFECALSRRIEMLYEKRQAGFPSSSAGLGGWQGEAAISEEYEGFFGRADFAESQGGGYYAARLAVAEALARMKRQARCIVFREIGSGYSVPVGVWEVRENVRHAFMKSPVVFDTLPEALAYLAGRLAVPLAEYLKRSRVLAQRRLNEF